MECRVKYMPLGMPRTRQTTGYALIVYSYLPSIMIWNPIIYRPYDLKLISAGLSLMQKPGEHSDPQPALLPASQSTRQDPQAYPLTESATIRQRTFITTSYRKRLTLTSPLAVKSSASSTSCKLPVTLPTIFNLLNATAIGGAPAMIVGSVGSPTATTVPLGRR